MPDPSKQPAPADPSKPRCTARTTAGPRCRRWPVNGAKVCATHGGSAPQVKAKATRRVAHDKALAEWERTYGGQVDVADPAETVLGEIRWAVGHVTWLRAKVQATDPDALVWGVESEVTKGAGEFPGVDVTKAAKPNIWLTLYDQERDRLIKMCDLAHRMGIAEQRVQLAAKAVDKGTPVTYVLIGVDDEALR